MIQLQKLQLNLGRKFRWIRKVNYTRQDVYKALHKDFGLCVDCPLTAVNATHCERHRIACNLRKAKYRILRRTKC